MAGLSINKWYHYVVKYKLLILDLDGTAVLPGVNSLPSPKVKRAVIIAKDKLKVTIATGRAHHNAKKIIDDLGLEGPGIVNGGSEVYELKTGELMYSKKIDLKTLKKLAELSKDLKYKKSVRSQGSKMFIEHPGHIDGPKERFTIYAVERSNLDQIIEIFKDIAGVSVHHAQSWSGDHIADVHITHQEGTKQHGLRHVAALYGFEPHEVIAIGNDHNDLPLLEAAGCAVAMGDSPEHVRVLADYVTKTIDEDGVAHAIEELILKEE